MEDTPELPQRNRIIKPVESPANKLEIKQDCEFVSLMFEKPMLALKITPETAIHMATNMLIQAQNAQGFRAKKAQGGSAGPSPIIGGTPE